MLVPARQCARGSGNGSLLYEGCQIDQLLVSPSPASAGDRTIIAIECGKKNQQLHFVECEVRSGTAIIAIMPTCDYRMPVFHAGQGFRSDATMGEAMMVCCGEIFHERFHIMVGHGVLVAFQWHAVAVEHQNGGFSIIGHTIHARSFQTGIGQAENHGVMMVHGVNRGTVATHGNTGQAKPLPYLVEISGRMHLIVEYGNGVLLAVIVDNIVNTGIFGQIVIQRGLQYSRIDVGGRLGG